MDAILCRDYLARLLVEENAALAELEPQLDREYEALASRDLAALESAADSRQLLLARLAKLEDERRAACSLHGYPPDREGLARLLEWCDPARSLTNHYQECLARAERCRAGNERNAALVAARMARVAGMLNALTGDSQRANTYARDGGNARSALAGRVVSLEA